MLAIEVDIGRGAVKETLTFHAHDDLPEPTMRVLFSELCDGVGAETGTDPIAIPTGRKSDGSLRLRKIHPEEVRAVRLVEDGVLAEECPARRAK